MAADVRSIADLRDWYTALAVYREGINAHLTAAIAMAEESPGGLLMPNQSLLYTGRVHACSQLAEMINALVYCSAASQHPPKAVKFEFLLIHALNCSVFFSAILDRPWISPRTKVRLLEWKGRMDLLLYVSRGTPPLDLDEIVNYPVTRNWKELFSTGNTHPADDSHIVKLVRAIANGERVCKPLEDRGEAGEFMIKGDAWLKAGNMAIDSTLSDQRWIFGNGFDEAWSEVEDRPRL